MVFHARRGPDAHELPLPLVVFLVIVRHSFGHGQGVVDCLHDVFVCRIEEVAEGLRRVFRLDARHGVYRGESQGLVTFLGGDGRGDVRPGCPTDQTPAAQTAS